MFQKPYQLLPQRDPTSPRTPGLFVDLDGFDQPSYSKGRSFDNMPNVSQNDFTGMKQHYLQERNYYIVTEL